MTTTPDAGASTGVPNPVKASGASVATRVRQVLGAGRPRASTGTRSIA
ncbi:hypothetical protein IWX63_002799 [Arthrobacter sp. CAN_A2]